jgi:hypothetical protein
MISDLDRWGFKPPESVIRYELGNLGGPNTADMTPRLTEVEQEASRRSRGAAGEGLIESVGRQATLIAKREARTAVLSPPPLFTLTKD